MTALVIGGGLAGLSAAVELAQRGHRVTILEARSRIGGRAGSFVDPASGELVDACQHVSMGCCTAFERFCDTVGIGHLLAPQRTLWFITPDGLVSPFSADRLPAPFHLTRSFLRAHYLSWGDKLRIAYGLLRLRMTKAHDDRPFLPWLRAQRQSTRAIERFWNVVLVSALNETIDHVGLKYARKVFVDAFLSDRRGFEVRLPTVPLARLYGEELTAWFAAHGVTVVTNAAVTSIDFDGEAVRGVTLRDGSTRTADLYVAALTATRLAALSPSLVPNLDRFEPSPIISVHCWFDGPLITLPHVVLVDCVGHWVFRRGDGYLQVVISAARVLAAEGVKAIAGRVVAELRLLFPTVPPVRLLRTKVVIEKAATFAPTPGIDAFRPGPSTPFRNLALAGDWTATGWPATMEGAVRSGTAAAVALDRTFPVLLE